MAFVDYEKAFDSVEHWARFNSLHRCSIDIRRTLRGLAPRAVQFRNYASAASQAKWSRTIQKEGATGRYYITEALYGSLRRRNKDAFLSHLRFADDLVLFAETLDDL